MNKAERARADHALLEGAKKIRGLLREARGRQGPISVNDPDYAQAFGIAQGLALVGLMAEPGLSTSEFQKLLDLANAKTCSCGCANPRDACDCCKAADRELKRGRAGK